ncbi:DUF2243 domain-containing protein [Hymenobacter profundi]|uniref:DUF2243 domain-containing protein n=1 Tax=Hymenobacter profundi TaxID=1982110 RepID=A0ABS6WU88_9BACT|nr:DUF2243 domain-containing protein [Hymenobacter profundi]
MPWSGRSFSGALILGWGLFNVIEGIIDHEVLGLHHVYEYTDNHLPADLGFLAFGALQLALGWALIRAGRVDAEPAAGRR